MDGVFAGFYDDHYTPSSLGISKVEMVKNDMVAENQFGISFMLVYANQAFVTWSHGLFDWCSECYTGLMPASIMVGKCTAVCRQTSAEDAGLS